MWEVIGAVGAVGAVLVAVIYGWPAFRREISRAVDDTRPVVADWDWCVAQGIDADALLADLISLDYSALAGAGLDGQSEGHVVQWAPVFEASPETWRLIIIDNKIVAYWSFFSLAPDLQQKMLKGDLFDSEIVQSKIRRLDQPGIHSIYVPMFGMHKWVKDRRWPIFKLLMRSFYDQIAALESEGIIFEDIHANGFTREGAALVRTLGFTELCPAKQGGVLYGRKIDDDLKVRVKRFLRRLDDPLQPITSEKRPEREKPLGATLPAPPLLPR